MYTLLLVDDEERMLDLLELYLAPNGYRCVKRRSGRKPLTICGAIMPIWCCLMS